MLPLTILALTAWYSLYSLGGLEIVAALSQPPKYWDLLPVLTLLAQFAKVSHLPGTSCKTSRCTYLDSMMDDLQIVM